MLSITEEPFVIGDGERSIFLLPFKGKEQSQMAKKCLRDIFRNVGIENIYYVQEKEARGGNYV